MSNNIENVTTLVFNNARMKASDIVKLCRKHEHDLPESSFLHEVLDKATDVCADGHDQKEIALPNLWWNSSGSGRSYQDVLVKEIAPKILGEVEAVFTWEGGHVSGLLIKDGKVAEADVVQALKKPEGW